MPNLDAGPLAGVVDGADHYVANDALFGAARCDVVPAGCPLPRAPALARGIEIAPAVVALSSQVALDGAGGELDAWRGAERGCGAGHCFDDPVAAAAPDAIEVATAIEAEEREPDEDAAAPSTPPGRAIPMLSAVPVIGTLPEGALPVVGAFGAAAAAPTTAMHRLGTMPGTESAPGATTPPAIGPLPRPGVMPGVGAIFGAGAAPFDISPAASEFEPGPKPRNGSRSITSSPQWRSVVAMLVPVAFALAFLGAAGYALWSRRRF